MSESQLRRLIAERSQAAADETFVEDARSDRRVTYRQLEGSVRAWSRTLDAAEVTADANVLLDVSDPVAFAVALLGVIASGRCAVPTDPSAPDGEKARLAAAVGAALTISDGATPTAMPVGLDGYPTAGAGPALSGSGGAGRLRLNTSGSTGEPKAVELTEAQLLHVAGQVADHNALVPADRGYNSLPLFHINAEVVAVLATLVAGSTLVLDRRFQRRGFWELMTERRITWVNAVPAMLAILAREPLPQHPGAIRFIRSASAPLPASVRAVFVEAFGPILVESYGMTEAGSQITATALAPATSPEGTVGPARGVDLQIRDDTGRVAAAGVAGRIWIHGAGVIDHYVEDRASERFDAEGWLDTGDLGQLDHDGNLTHLGRADDVINRGGELVHPREIEEVLLGDGRVLDAVVVGRADEILGEVPVAYLVSRGGGKALRADLVRRCEQHLSRFKRPTELIFVDELPRAATGKILRSEVSAGRP